MVHHQGLVPHLIVKPSPWDPVVVPSISHQGKVYPLQTCHLSSVKHWTWTVCTCWFDGYAWPWEVIIWNQLSLWEIWCPMEHSKTCWLMRDIVSWVYVSGSYPLQLQGRPTCPRGQSMCTQEGTIEEPSKLSNLSEKLTWQSRELREEWDQETSLRRKQEWGWPPSH